MADVDTMMLSREHSDIRREIANEAGNSYREQATIRREVANESCGIHNAVNNVGRDGISATKDARHDTETAIHSLSNKLRDQATQHYIANEQAASRGRDQATQYYIAGEQGQDKIRDQSTQFYIAGQNVAAVAARDLAALTAAQNLSTTTLGFQIQTSGERAAAAAALESARLGAAIALGQANIERVLRDDGEKTRVLMNDLKYHDLSRGLLERNAALVECESDSRHLTRLAAQSQNQGQFAAIQSQIQAFASQLQETRLGMVNFGSMNGVGQSSTSNNA